MAKMVKADHCKRERGNISEEYIYYQKKPSRFPHALLITEFYISILELGAEVIEYYVETKFGDIIPDGIFVIKYKGKTQIFAIEVQLSNNTLDTQKYIDFYKSGKWRDHMPAFPKVVFICNRSLPKVDSPPLIFMKINTDLKNLEKIFE